jgi:DNA repair protein RecN (Recombination protein N)
MLDELIVRNLGIIAEAQIEPGNGLVVVTGETGAGKTMLLGALRLLVGDPSRREVVGQYGEESVVDGRFLIAGEEMTLRRRVTAEGRSKAYANDSMVPARALQERTRNHVEIVGQHEHMLLSTPSGARRLLDGALSTAGQKSAATFAAAWQALVEVRHQIELLGGSRHELERELEIQRFQAEEIDQASFAPGDDEALTSRVARLRNSEDLVAGLGAVLEGLGDTGASEPITRAAAVLRRLVGIDPSLADQASRLEELLNELADLQMDIASVAVGLEHEPGELEHLESRLHLLGELRRKYGDSLEEILQYGSQAENRAADIHALLQRSAELGTELSECEATAKEAAAALTEHRMKAARRIENAATGHLRDLGMSGPTVRFEFATTDLGPAGGDRVDLLFASDAALAPGLVGRVASGGELSRLTLALRLAAGISDAAVIAFDEIDAGVGGATARAMGEKLAALSAGRQVFCVSHLPQVAAHADAHFVVERAGPDAVVRRVDGDERLAELSRMLGGLPDSERGQLHAAELLESVRD